MSDSDAAFRKDVAKTLADNSMKVLQDSLALLSEDSSPGALARGKIFELTKHQEWAIASYQEALDRDGTSREALARLAIAQIQASDYEKALNSAVKHASNGDDFIVESLCQREKYSPMTILGEALLVNERPDQSADAFRQALSLNAYDSFSAGRLAYLYLVQGKLKEAIALEPAVKNTPRYRYLRSLLKLAANNPSTLPSIELKTLMSISAAGAVGRPITVDGEVRLARLQKEDTWCANLVVANTNMSPKLSGQLSSEWLHAGQGEHASVASFARFVLQLLGLGAPPTLVREAIKAMADEVDHACDSFSIGSQLAGEFFSPGKLDVSDVLSDGADERSILRDALIEGCVAETISAQQAIAASERAEDPAIKTVLTRIASEESNHAELAWRFVDWMLQKYPELSDELDILPAIEQAYLNPAEGTPLEPFEAPERYGVLSEESKRTIRDKAFKEIIKPRMDDLLLRWRGASVHASEGATSRPIPVDKAWLSANGFDKIPA